MPADNPPFPTAASGGTGADPDFAKQWGMNDIGLKKALSKHRGEGVIVAVIDTGVDYTHEDLVDNMWHNKGEMGTDASGKDKSSNGVDDDGNGFVDDVIGWDFVSKDNKPFDLAVDPIQILMGGGNPGHGTHCAGNVAARGDNGKGVEGIAPNAQIMALRFLSEKGEGDTAGAIQAIDYAVKNGANVLSNSWGSEGDDPAEADKNQALKDAITRANDKGVIFIAAAGNGHSGVGYDSDTDAKPGMPASYTMPNIVSVAAIGADNNLGAFSNWGARTVQLAAPGVAVYSTTVGGHYSDTVVDMYGIKATWDGTSMACPHVAGAAALYLSAHPGATPKMIKDALNAAASPLPNLAGKMVSGGKLNLEKLMAN
jgi:thermitase